METTCLYEEYGYSHPCYHLLAVLYTPEVFVLGQNFVRDLLPPIGYFVVWTKRLHTYQHLISLYNFHALKLLIIVFLMPSGFMIICLFHHFVSPLQLSF